MKDFLVFKKTSLPGLEQLFVLAWAFVCVIVLVEAISHYRQPKKCIRFLLLLAYLVFALQYVRQWIF